jgi:hypothetical protein
LAQKVKDDDMSGKFAWTVTIAALVLITYSQCHSRDGRDFGIRTPVTHRDGAPSPRRAAVVDDAVEATADSAGVTAE